MDNVLQTALAETVNSLASFFGTTTEAIMNHAPEFLAKYGWYSTLNTLSKDIFLSICLVALICAIGFIIYALSDMELKHPGLVVFGIIIISMVIGVGTKIITCAVAPEIVGAHAVLDLLKSVK